MADGKDCKCYASGEAECACGVDWTPQKFYDVLHIAEQLQFWARRYADGRMTYAPEDVNQLTAKLIDLGGKPTPETAGRDKGSVWANDPSGGQSLVELINKYGTSGTGPNKFTPPKGEGCGDRE